MRALRVLSVSALLLCLVLPGPAQAQGRRRRGRGKSGQRQKDKGPRVSSLATIYLRQGRPLRKVSVREAGHDVVKYKERGRSTQEIKAERVREIRFLRAPGHYSSGLSKYRAGQFEKAAEAFALARSTAPEKSWVWPFSTYWLGQSKLMAGDAAGAAKEFQALLSKHAEHFLAPAALYGLGQAQSAQGKASQAEATFAKLDEGYGDYWRARAALGAGDAALAAKNATKARGHYQKAEGRASRYPEIRQAAQVGIGKSYVLSKAYDRAIEYFEGIINSSGSDPEVAAHAWVGKGDCLYAKAEAKRGDPALLKQALIAYQTCSVRYAGVPEAYPKALYQAGRIYERLGLAKLAEAQRRELKTRCPSTSWAAKLK
ncbi:MAG: hypothetical protein D6731_00705 [Planctomycetota bacterium]|nr:MAG: hypothetical protein D6731_00705 [Planctomycetota bacterium]